MDVMENPRLKNTIVRLRPDNKGAISYLRGHEIEWNGSEWVYSDTKESVEKTYKDRPCGKCGKPETEQGHDACLGTLPGVMNACCGHGKDGAYVQFYDGVCVRGKDAEVIIEILKKIK